MVKFKRKTLPIKEKTNGRKKGHRIRLAANLTVWKIYSINRQIYIVSFVVQIFVFVFQFFFSRSFSSTFSVTCATVSSHSVFVQQSPFFRSSFRIEQEFSMFSDSIQIFFHASLFFSTNFWFRVATICYTICGRIWARLLFFFFFLFKFSIDIADFVFLLVHFIRCARNEWKRNVQCFNSSKNIG